MIKVLQDPIRPPAPQGLVLALGNFDGVHKGHRALLTETGRLAEKLGAESGVVTFYPHTGVLLRPQNQVLYTEQQKQRLLEETGRLAWLIRLTFDRNRMEQSPDDFFYQVLRKQLDARGIVIGENFRFGCRGSGDAAKMQELCRNAGVACSVVPQVMEDGAPVSSTRIRRLIRDGRMEKAARLLTQPYRLEGTVVPGKHLGTRLQVPTINIFLESDQLVPREGVYVSRTFAGSQGQASITNVGCNPTVGGEALRTETHILDAGENLYGREVRVELLRFLRPEICFENTDALQKQLMQDIKTAREYFESNNLGG